MSLQGGRAGMHARIQGVFNYELSIAQLLPVCAMWGIDRGSN